jgi:glycosyltransferase involved in cell wall biosynthesis
MKATLLIPFIQPTGGIRGFFEHANRLTRHGHEVTIVCPMIPLRFGNSLFNPRFTGKLAVKTIRNLFIGKRVNWFTLRARLKIVPTLNHRFIPAGDVVIATAWPTASYMEKYPAAKGRKVYFVQHYEVEDGPKDLIDRTYRIPARYIAISDFSARVVNRNFGTTFDAIVPCGINLQMFYNPDKRFNLTKRIMMFYSRGSRKGAEDGLKAITLIKEKHPEVAVSLFGFGKYGGQDKNIVYHRNPDDERLRKLYCQHDIFLYSSRYEGYGLPPMEAMACKCAVVTTNVGAIPSYTIAGETAILCEPNDPRALADGAIKLIEDEALLRKISLAGYGHIRNFTWEKSADRLEQYLKSLL